VSKFDELPGDYNERLSENLRPITANAEYFTEYRVELAHRLTGGRATAILDFGCGVGNSLGHLLRRFPHAAIFACDASLPSVDEARVRYPQVEFIDNDVLPTSRFDLVFVAGVVHHIEPAARPEVLRRITGALGDDGVLAIFEHNPLNPVTRSLVASCIYDDDATLISRRALHRLIETEPRLDVVGGGYTVFVPPALRRLRPAERMVGWLPLGAQYYVKAQRTSGRAVRSRW